MSSRSFSTFVSGKRILAIASGIILAFIALPLLAVTWISFFSDRIITVPPEGYTYEWYVSAWQQPVFRDGFTTSLVLGLYAMVSSFVLGLPSAFLIARGNFPGRNLLQLVLLSPLLVPGIVAGAAALIFFIDIEMWTGFQLAGALPGLSLVHIAVALPWSVRILTAALLRLDPTLEEAAIGLGASRAVVLRRIILPAISPAVFAAALFGFIASFIDLEFTLFMVGPGQTTLPIAVMNYVAWSLDPTVAAVSAVQIAIVFVVLMAIDRIFGLARTI
ncbi:MAG: ABC transporter permease [Mesorhizobium sp.]